jgi:hypothetical protein
MPIFCEHLAAETLKALNDEVRKLPSEHHLRKDSTDGIVSIAYDAKQNVTIFHAKSGFYFRRGGLVESIRADLNFGRGLICSAYELTDDTNLPESMKATFQEKFGQKGARKIDTYLAHFNDRIFLLAKIPRDVMKILFEPDGGVLKTHFKGPRHSLVQIPTLTKYLEFKDPTDPTDPKPIESVFATEYTKGHLDYTRAVHYQILQDIVRSPGLGITLGPIAAWTS